MIFLRLLFYFFLVKNTNQVICCSKKSVNGELFSFVGTAREIEREKFGCKDDCVYSKEGSSKKFCFAEGRFKAECLKDEEGLSALPPDGQDCQTGDFNKYIITSGYDFTVNIVDKIVEVLKTDPNITNRKGPYGANSFLKINDDRAGLINGKKPPPNGIKSTANHVIPWGDIAEKLVDMAKKMKSSQNKRLQNSLKKLVGTNRYKSNTWHARITEMKEDIDMKCGSGGKTLTSALDDVAREIIKMLCWTPGNLFLGPDSGLREKDPGTSGKMDVEIIESLQNDPKAIFKEYMNKDMKFEFNPKYGNDWFTIIDVLAKIDSKAITGPAWTLKTNQKWITQKNLNKNKICYADFLSFEYNKMCPTPQGQQLPTEAFIDVTTGKSVCRPPQNEALESLCGYTLES